MKYNISNEKLKMIVDELGEEYKDMIITKSLSNSKEIDVDEIVPSDLIRIDLEVKSSLTMDEHEYKRKRIYTLSSMVGVMYAIMGLFLLIYKELDNYMFEEPTTLISIMCIFIGLIISLMASFMKIYPRRRRYSFSVNNTSHYEIISKWKELEALIIQLTPEEKQGTLKEMIGYLKETNIINSDDTLMIREILNYRNRIVHSSIEDDKPSLEYTRQLLKKTNEIIQKLKKII